MKFENGNYLNYTSQNYENRSFNYKNENNFVNYNKNICTEQQTDGKYSQSPPFYQLRPTPQKNCIFYNYTLPYNYPFSGGSRTPNPINYWYFPYYKDPTFYENAIQVPKPG